MAITKSADEHWRFTQLLLTLFYKIEKGNPPETMSVDRSSSPYKLADDATNLEAQMLSHGMSTYTIL